VIRDLLTDLGLIVLETLVVSAIILIIAKFIIGA